MPQTLVRSLAVLVEPSQPSHPPHLALELEQIGAKELIAERVI